MGRKKSIKFRPGLVLESKGHYHILGDEVEEGIIYHCKISKGSLGFLLLGDQNELHFEFGEVYPSYIAGCIKSGDMKPASNGIVKDIITLMESRGNGELSYENKMFEEMGIKNIRDIFS